MFGINDPTPFATDTRWHKTLPPNTKGRDFFVGDIHGCITKLRAALAAVGFEHADRLISVGDLIDRGENSMDVVREFIHRPNFFAVRGNHEQMMLDAYHGHFPGAHANHLQNGGTWSLLLEERERTAALDYFATLPIALSVQTFVGLIGVVHADCRHDDWGTFVRSLNALPVDAEPPHDALWSRDRWRDWMPPTTITGVHAVVVGHTPNKKHQTLWSGNVLNIDTYAYGGGPITLHQF